MKIAAPQTDTIIIGFDSAWTDSPKAPGAICAVAFDGGGMSRFIAPRPASFAAALDFIEAQRQGHGLCLVALDQPTIVPNANGIRPAERVAAAMISFIGGGVQPANRSKRGMFCDAAPIWRFRRALGAVEHPEASRAAPAGLFLIEVFPALALAGLHAPFAGRLRGPKYNPANRKKFRMADWQAVAQVVAGTAHDLGVPALAEWASELSLRNTPRKADQDLLDAAICALVGLIWRGCERRMSAMIGDLETGYIIAPVSEQTRSRLRSAAEARGVAFT